MYTGLLHFHSFWRYIVLITIIIAIVKAYNGLLCKKEAAASKNKAALFAMIAMHIQLLVGFILYFISPITQSAFADMGNAMKMPELRFWSVEHTSMMVIAATLITIGNMQSKKAATALAGYKKVAVFYTLALLVILFAVPWPFSAVARPWF